MAIQNRRRARRKWNGGKIAPKKYAASMGRRTGAEPDGTQPIFMRICHALDMKPHELAKTIGLKYKDVQPLEDARIGELNFSGDDTWWRVSEYVDRQLGLLLAIKMDLSRALQKDRSAQALRREQLAARGGKPSPR